MKKIITAMLAAGLLVVSSWAAPRAEVAAQDKYNYKVEMGVYDAGSGNLIPLNVRLNVSGHTIVDAGPNTITVAGPQLEAIKDATQAIEGIGNTTLAELETQSLQLGIIEGNGTTAVANQEIMKLQLGVIEGNGTTLNVTASTIDAGVTAINTELDSQSLQLGVIEGNGTTGTASLAAIELEQIAQSLQLGVIEGNGTTSVANEEIMKLQLGVIEGNGTTLNVTATAIDAGVTAINSELDAQSLQLGVIEGNGTTLNVTASAIDAGVTAINTELDSQSLQLGVIEGNGTTLNVTAAAIDAGVTAINTELDSQSLQLGVIEGNGTTSVANQEIIKLQLGVIEGNGITAVARLDSALLELGAIEGNGNTLLAEVESQSLQLGVIEGNGTTGTAALVSIDGKMVSGTDIGDVTVNNATGAAGVYVQGQQADGAAAVGGSLRIAGRDNSDNAQDIFTDSGGRVVVVGGGADGSGVVGLPLRIGGKDGAGNTQDIMTDTDGNLQMDVVAELPAGTQQIGNVAIADGSAVTADVGDGAVVDYLYVRLTDGTDSSSLDGSGNLEVVGEAGGDVKVTLDGETVELAAGTASIGTLGANSGVDIGDATINNAAGASAVNIQDGGNTITVDGTVIIADASANTIGARAVLDGSEWHFVADWAAAQTNTVVMTCPAGKRIVFTYAFYTANDTQTFQFQDEDDTDVSPTVYCNGQGSGAVEPGAKNMPLWILDTDKDLEIDTTQAVDHGIRATGYIID